MPFYNVEGRAKSTGRKLKSRRFLALHAQAATVQAKKSGMTTERVELLKIAHVICNVAGASHDNLNGTDRQAIVAKANTRTLSYYDTNSEIGLTYMPCKHCE